MFFEHLEVNAATKIAVLEVLLLSRSVPIQEEWLEGWSVENETKFRGDEIIARSKSRHCLLGLPLQVRVRQ